MPNQLTFDPVCHIIPMFAGGENDQDALVIDLSACEGGNSAFEHCPDDDSFELIGDGIVRFSTVRDAYDFIEDSADSWDLLRDRVALIEVADGEVRITCNE